MTKYVPYAIIVALIIGLLIFVSGRTNAPSNTNNNIPNETMTKDAGPSPLPVSQVDLNDNVSVQAAIDAEMNQIDRELGGISDTELDDSGLSDQQLGL